MTSMVSRVISLMKYLKKHGGVAQTGHRAAEAFFDTWWTYEDHIFFFKYAFRDYSSVRVENIKNFWKLVVRFSIVSVARLLCRLSPSLFFYFSQHIVFDGIVVPDGINFWRRMRKLAQMKLKPVGPRHSFSATKQALHKRIMAWCCTYMSCELGHRWFR